MQKKTFIVLLIFSISPILLSAQAKWADLFNGKDFTGWKQLNGKASYEVIKGEIVGTTVLGEPNSFLATEGLYKDFILEMEYKLDADMNSGIQFRSESKPDYLNGRVHGYQIEIDPSDRAWTGGLYDEARREWLYPLEYNVPGKKAYKKGEWNRIRLECIGDVMRIWINGIPTSNVSDDLTQKGFIALQVHAIGKQEEVGKKIRWRNIKIQTQSLKPSPPDDIFVVNLVANTLTEQEIKNNVSLLWDGKSSAGWRGAGKESFPENGWELNDGMLSVMKSADEKTRASGDIVTIGEYSAFDLQFEFKLTDGANSGVKYFAIEKDGAALGLEYQVLDDEKHTDAKKGVVGNRTQGSLYDLIPALQVKRGQHKIGVWNYGRIIVFPDNRVEHWLNGYKVVEYQRKSLMYQALVARSKYATIPDFGMADKGHILLQDHGDQVFYRSIKIKEFIKP